jgi:uncharacterized protein YigA (DUF484 family)
MIKNARQLDVTKQQLGRLSAALEALRNSEQEDDATRARIGALEADIARMEHKADRAKPPSKALAS